MADLRTIQGGSTIPDFTQGLANLRQLNVENKQRGIRDESQELVETLAQPGLTPGDEQKALLRLTTINPALAKNTSAILDRGDAQELTILQNQANEANRFATVLNGIQDKRQRDIVINDKIKQIQASPNPDPGRIQRLIDLKNKTTKEEQDVAIQAQIVTSTDIKNLSDIRANQKKQQEVLRNREIVENAQKAATLLNTPIDQQAVAIAQMIEQEIQEQKPGFEKRVEELQRLSGMGATQRATRLTQIRNAARKVEDIGKNFDDILDDKGNIIGKRNRLTNEPTFFAGVFGSRGRPSKGQSFKVVDEDGNTTIQTVVFDPNKPEGQRTTLSPNVIEGDLVSPLGETAGQQTDRRVEEASRKRQRVLAVDEEKLPLIEAKKLSATQAIQASKKAFDQIPAVNDQIELYDQAIDAVVAGAGTGPIERFLPTFREATTKLQAIQSQLGLKIISGVTLGAINEKELDLVLQAGVPEGLDGEPLKQFLRDKRDATLKFRDYLEDAAEHLGTPGNTISGFVAKNRRQREREERRSGDNVEAQPGATPENMTDDELLRDF